jgi:hypothetical protein
MKNEIEVQAEKIDEQTEADTLENEETTEVAPIFRLKVKSNVKAGCLDLQSCVR